MQLNYFAQVFQETIYVKFSPELKKKIVFLMWNNGCERLRSNESGYKVC